MESPDILLQGDSYLQRVLCCSGWKTMGGSNRTTEIVASFPHNSQPGSNSLREEDIPGASLNGRSLVIFMLWSSSVV